MKKVLLSWSCGKDSAWSLYRLRQDPDIEVVGLLTSLNSEFDRVAMHAVRRELLEMQAAATGLELWPIELPHPCSDEQYRAAMGEAMERAQAAGIDAVAFGDLYLEDVRQYRLDRMAGTGIEPLFPLWKLDTTALAKEMQAGGLRARITCVNPKQIDAGFAGREWDAQLVTELPEGADSCGENGEFHTFVHAGPMFAADIAIAAGEVVNREGFEFADILPAAGTDHG